MFFIDDDEREVSDGREDGRARPDDDGGVSVVDTSPLGVALRGGEAGVEHRDALATEAREEPPDGLGGQCDFGD